MQEGMYYLKTCVSGGHVFHENVLWEDMCGMFCRSVHNNHLSCGEFRHLVVVVFVFFIIYRIYCLISSSWV